MPTFKNKREAIASGYVPANGRHLVTIETYRDIDIIIRDISYGNSYGYDYAIGLPLEKTDWKMKNFGESVTVSLTHAENKIGYTGACTAMFSPETYSHAIDKAKKFIDDHLVKQNTEGI